MELSLLGVKVPTLELSFPELKFHNAFVYHKAMDGQWTDGWTEILKQYRYLHTMPDHMQ